jgi:hypothetical protein
MSEFKSSSFRNEDNSGAPDIVGVSTFTSPYYFVPPSGTTAERPSGDGLAPGMLRFNTDIGRLEVWRGDHWATILGESPNLGVNGALGARGVFGGGYVPGGGGDQSRIDYITVSSLGNAITFGNLSTSRRGLSACGSATRGLFMGAAGASSQRIDFITYSSTGDATTFGTLSTNKEGNGAFSSNTRAISFGGDNVGSGTNVIEYMTIASQSNGIDFGDLLNPQTPFTGGIASSTRGITGGGDIYPAGTRTNTIQYVTISTLGNSIRFGDLTVGRSNGTSASNSTRGLFMGGSPSPTSSNVIDFITISSLGNAQDFGDLIVATDSFSACTSPTRGLYAGGRTPTQTNTIGYVNILTTGNAIDFGDLTIARFGLGSCSNAHGGL